MADDINVNMIADQLAKKVDLPDNKGQDGIDYVVEWKAPTESDPTWYRVYKSGWVEQGGIIVVTTDGTTIQLSKPMKDITYNICSLVVQNANFYNRCFQKETLVIGLASSGGNNLSSWEVKGQGANQ